MVSSQPPRIGFMGQLLRHADWSLEQQTADRRRQIDRALELGYDVLVVRLWHIDQEQLERESGMIADRHQLAPRPQAYGSALPAMRRYGETAC